MYFERRLASCFLMRISTIFNTTRLLALLALVALCNLLPAINRCAHADSGPSGTPPPSPAPLGVLAAAIQAHDVGSGGPALLKVLADLGAALNSGKGVGASIQEILASGGIPAASQEPLRQTLLANWRSAYEFGFLTTENLACMRAGTLPVVTIGGYRGQATVILSVPTENGTPSGFFRLVPVPLQQSIFQSTTAGTVFAAGSPAAPPRMMSQPGTAGAYPGAWPPRMTPRYLDMPAPSATPSPMVDFVDIARGGGISLQKYGGGTETIYIHVANEKDGVYYGMVDPAKMKVTHEQGWGDYGPTFVIRRIPNTTYHTAPWKFTPIPGTSEMGVFVTRYMGASIYFVKVTVFDGDHYRMCVVSDRRGPEFSEASPRPR
jgi:hypothetical protein